MNNSLYYFIFVKNNWIISMFLRMNYLNVTKGTLGIPERTVGKKAIEASNKVIILFSFPAKSIS